MLTVSYSAYLHRISQSRTNPVLSVVAYFEDEDEQTDDWSDTTTIEAASVKDLAYLKRDVDELRRGLRTVWVLCIFALASLVVSLAFLASRPVGLSQEDLKEVLKDNKVDQVLELLEGR